MTTVIRSSHSVFNSENILQLGDLFRDGLVAAFRPSNEQGGLIDLSGNGHVLIKRGNPTLTSQEMIGDSNNGYTTSISETLNLTYTAVYKVLPTGTDYRSLAVNSFNISPVEGSSIFTEISASLINFSLHAKQSGSSGNATLKTNLSHSVERYVFVALVVNSETGVMTSCIPATGVVINTPQGNNLSIAGRILSRQTVSLAYSPGTPIWLGKSHIAEALIYNKALTTEQIMTQYRLSKDAMAKRGIII